MIKTILFCIGLIFIPHLLVLFSWLVTLGNFNLFDVYYSETFTPIAIAWGIVGLGISIVVINEY